MAYKLSFVVINDPSFSVCLFSNREENGSGRVLFHRTNYSHTTVVIQLLDFITESKRKPASLYFTFPQNQLQ